MKIQKWCPNCEYFFKDFGMNNCKLVDWKINPYGGNDSIRNWLKYNSDASTRINDTADNCPGFVPYGELAQKFWKEKSEL